MSSFAERLAIRSKYSKRISDIKPALTPDILPETLGVRERALISEQVITRDSTRSRADIKSPLNIINSNNNYNEDNIQTDIQEASPSSSRTPDENNTSHQHNVGDPATHGVASSVQADRVLERQNSPLNNSLRLQQGSFSVAPRKVSDIGLSEEGKYTSAKLIAANPDSSNQSVTISIDKIEVRAIMPEKSVSFSERHGNMPRTLTLEEYLKRRREGSI